MAEPAYAAARRASGTARNQALCRACCVVALLAALATGRPALTNPTPYLEVEILDPEDGAIVSTQVRKVQVVVRTTRGTTVRLYPLVDGKRVPSEPRGLELRAETQLPTDGARPPIRVELLQSVEVHIPRTNCTVAVAAETAFATRMSQAVRLNWRETEGFVVRPKLYLLAIGVSTYREGDLALRYASKDASDFARAFQAQQGGLFEQVHLRTLLDQQATRDNILDGLQWLQRQTTANDVAILFLAGHGIDDPSNGVYYFVPHDAESNAAMRTMISQQSLQTALRSIAGKALLFLDTCHAASIMNDGAGRAVSDVSRLIQELASVENGLVVYAAASGRQLSQESPRWENGAFTKAVVEGIMGRAAYHAGRPITAQMLNLYVSERVKELTSGAQTPIMVTTNKMADFPLALTPVTSPPEKAPFLPPPARPPAVLGPSAWPAPLPPLTSTVPRPTPGEAYPSAGGPQPGANPDAQRERFALERALASSAAKPIYKKAWLWLSIGGAALALGGVAVYAVVASGASGAPSMNANGTLLSFKKVE